jgi:murein DD-endopeptidase MepM/ murein hydrolase activator NlpD
VNPETRLEVVSSGPSASEPGSVADAESVVAAVAARGFARRLVSSPRRRPTLYLAAALVAATSLGAVTAGPQAVAATPAGHSVSIAHELGIDRQSVAVTPADAQRLQQLAASRNQRSAEEVAAAQAQAAANARAAEAALPKAVLPVHGAQLTSTFGMRWGVLHAGIDLAAPLGTPEYAAMDGVVLRAGPASGFGLAVYIQHANGDVTVYGHMEKILVTDGQIVRAGETIALLGANGQATGPHLHFEVHIGGMMGTKVDPIPWLRARGVVV